MDDLKALELFMDINQGDASDVEENLKSNQNNENSRKSSVNSKNDEDNALDRDHSYENGAVDDENQLASAPQYDSPTDEVNQSPMLHMPRDDILPIVAQPQPQLGSRQQNSQPSEEESKDIKGRWDVVKKIMISNHDSDSDSDIECTCKDSAESIASSSGKDPRLYDIVNQVTEQMKRDQMNIEKDVPKGSPPPEYSPRSRSESPEFEFKYKGKVMFDEMDGNSIATTDIGEFFDAISLSDLRDPDDCFDPCMYCCGCIVKRRLNKGWFCDDITNVWSL